MAWFRSAKLCYTSALNRVLIAILVAAILAAQPSPDEIRAIAEDGYTFAYPLVLMDLTHLTANATMPPNFFANAQAFPDASFHAVIRPNADTLYSSAWLDLSNEPILLQVPDTHGRYYLMQFMDAWTETFAIPGARTTGTNEKWFAVVGPNWRGQLPRNVERIDSPTNTVWLLGRTQTNTAADYPAVHEIQKQYTLMPLSRYPDGVKPPAPRPQPAADPTPPPSRIARMDAAAFFAAFAGLLVQNPPHPADAPIMARLAKIGIVPGKPFRVETLGPEGLRALEEGTKRAAQRLTPSISGAAINGWRGLHAHIGRYGTDYLTRAQTARAGLGANPPEDAIYISAAVDRRGAPLDGSHQYKIHFTKPDLPPVNAFWSLTLYDQDGYFAANPINRFAIGDRDSLHFNPDGSLDLLIQNAQPSSTTNWLPAPVGRFSLMLRLYWPKDDVLQGRWTPPAVEIQ